MARTLTYTRREVFEDCDAILERSIQANPARRAVVDGNRAAIVDAVLAAADRSPEGRLAFDQPVKADILRPAGRA